MKTITKKMGLSASIAFALMLAAGFSATAQKKTTASTDGVEVKESVEANVLASTVQKLNAQWDQAKAQNNLGKIEVMKEPVVKEAKEVSKRLNLPWHFTGGLGDLPTNAEKYQSGSTDDCPSGSDTVCELIAPDDGSGQPDMEAEVEIEGETETQTVAQRIADAIANGPNETVTRLKSN